MKLNEALEILKEELLNEELLNEGSGSTFNAKIFFSKKMPENLKISDIRERRDAAGGNIYVIKATDEEAAGSNKYVVFTQCDKNGLHSKHDKLSLEEANKLFNGNGKFSAETGSEPCCETKKKNSAECKTNCTVKNANTPEIVAMVLTKLKKAGVDSDVAIKLSRPIASTIASFEKKNGSLDLNDFDAELYSKLRTDFEKISALKDKADKVAQKIVDGYHNC